MATGGIFQLITNDGKQDRMLMATALLNKRLLEIEKMRAQNPQIKDSTPTLVDIERTHILFMNAHFKPFCAIGYEYNKVGPNGSVSLGGNVVQFSIPQFGDFFNDMVLHIGLTSVTASNADYWDDPVDNGPATGAELVAYVNNLGQSLVRKVAFKVNGNPLDDYDSEVMNFYQKFFVTPNKVVGWNRNVGQENPLQGFETVRSTTAEAAAHPTWQNRGAGARLGVQVFDGLQTPKPTQPAVDLWVPLLFWFNRDCRLSIPSVSIPYGQRFIDINLAPANEIVQQLHAYDPALDNPAVNPLPDSAKPTVSYCELWINNIFVNPEIHDIFIKRIGFSLIRVYRQQFNTVNKPSDNILLNNLKWPIETIYIGMRPNVNTSTSTSKLLTAWNMYCRVDPQVLDLCSLANGYNWQTAIYSSTYASVAPTPDQLGSLIQTYTGNLIDFKTAGTVSTLPTNYTWAQLNAALGALGYPPITNFGATPAATLTGGSVPAFAATTPNTVVGSGQEIYMRTAQQPMRCKVQYDKLAKTVDTIRIQAHGINLYQPTPVEFFNQYVPFTYGGNHINTPVDVGALMVTFNLYPGSYQPSGHVNVSRAREFYFEYTSSFISTLNEATMVVVAVAINFLLISDGSAVLRYST